MWDSYYDKHLQITWVREFYFLPGDICYFINPKVNPKEIEWQFENAVYLGNRTYYGHGIGITSDRGIIDHLNRHRIPGAVEPAYLLDYVIRPDYKRLATIVGPIPRRVFRETEIHTDSLKDLFVAQVGKTTYILT